MQTIKEGNEDVGVGKTGEKVKDRKRREKWNEKDVRKESTERKRKRKTER